MKKLFGLLVLLFIVAFSFAQEKMDAPKISKSNNLGNTRMVLDLTLDNWLNTPDSIKNNIIKSRGVNIYSMYEIPFGSSNFSVAFGIGFGSNNVSNNAKIIYSGDTLTLFEPIATSYKVNKISVNYVDVPLEIRFKTKADAQNQSFKFAVGFKGGYLVNSHTKYKDSGGKIKIYDIKNLSPYRYGANVRIGYGWFALTGYYSVSALFVKDKGPDIIPWSAGISINP